MSQLELRSRIPPRPTWGHGFSACVTAARMGMNLGKDRIDLFSWISTNVAAPLPTGKAIVEEVKIKSRDDLVLEFMTQEQASVGVTAEWIQDARLSNPPEKPADRVVLYIHGGAYFLASRKTHRNLTWRASKHSKARVLSVDYRLAPKHVYPLALHDVLSAYSYLINGSEAHSIGKDKKFLKYHRYHPSQIVIAGDSAGGGLAFSLLMYIRDHLDEFPMPAGIIGLAPWLDLTHSMPSFLDNGIYDYLPGRTNDKKYINSDRSFPYVANNSFLPYKYVSPLYAKESDGPPICPVLIQVGSAERLRDEGIYFAMQRFKNSDCRLEMYQDMIHIFQMFMPSKYISGVALRRFGQFVQDVTGHEAFVVDERAVLVLNTPPYRVVPLPKALMFVEQGLRRRGQTVADIEEKLNEVSYPTFECC
ncbi:hypothetical protein SeMB42_g03415 [Synchytrium endobioticum]|uniref:Alpha/beta hydrolase fold-3 domain-containing protein n=1 Tax=Synchytrium endobioticum TaxID=286115 RepID=A0A507CVE9_9FUNG|nr:hypothetical protein SeLEV6574_g05230 [Synchytrium endobioticum]TPX47246.1 hypothetical protein SeMB42_g03415 [Synchytrium endobioticum]